MSKGKDQQTLEPWERRENESARAYEAFCIYRDMGANRSLAKTAAEVGKSPKMMAKWSAEHAWVERCEAWDRWLAEERRKAHTEAIRKMEERHARLGEGMQTLAARKLHRELEKTDAQKVGKTAADAALDALGLQDTRLLITEGTKLERVARGEPETITENRVVEDWASAVTQRWQERQAREEAKQAEGATTSEGAQDGGDTGGSGG